MQDNEFEILKNTYKYHWWYKGRQDLIKCILEKFGNNKDIVIGDAGSGYGSNINFLKDYGKVFALESNKDALVYLKKEFKNIEVIKWKSPQKINIKFDLIVFADVLEHIKNDEKALKWTKDHLKTNGLVLITVPSHMYLWTSMDTNLYHYRRYNKIQLEKKLKKEFQIEFISYYNFLLFPLKICVKIFDQILNLFSLQSKIKSYNVKPNKFVNDLLYRIMSLERHLILKKMIPYGVSLICIAKKKINN